MILFDKKEDFPDKPRDIAELKDFSLRMTKDIIGEITIYFSVGNTKNYYKSELITATILISQAIHKLCSISILTTIGLSIMISNNII